MGYVGQRRIRSEETGLFTKGTDSPAGASETEPPLCGDPVCLQMCSRKWLLNWDTCCFWSTKDFLFSSHAVSVAEQPGELQLADVRVNSSAVHFRHLVIQQPDRLRIDPVVMMLVFVAALVVNLRSVCLCVCSSC